MDEPTIVSRDEWLAARKDLLAKEKAFTRQRDDLTRQRQQMPWVRVDKDYIFEGTGGPVALADLFDGRSQLIVYHFMYGPDWEVGCKACSFLTDHFDPAVVHLNHRDVSMVAVSRAPVATLEKFKARMGWAFTWVSSLGNDFNRDYHVSFTQEELDSGSVYYNYRMTEFPASEAPGASVFYKNDAGEIFHTYSAYQRGLDMFITAYHWLDIVPKGRDEAELPFTMAWVRHHDDYEG